MAFGNTTAVLASQVANAGTFTVQYPTGLTQANFLYGLAGTNNVLTVNRNDVYTSGFTLSYGASNITVTNSSLGTLAAGSLIGLQLDYRDAQSGDVITLTFPVQLANVTTTQDVVTDVAPGVDGIIEYFYYVANVPASTASKTVDFNLEIGTTNLTGGVLTLTTVAANTMGKVTAATAITGNNRITSRDLLSIEAANVTAFAEGSGSFHIRIRKV